MDLGCTGQGDRVPTEITSHEFRFYESSCTFARVTPLGPGGESWRIEARCAGEGEESRIGSRVRIRVRNRTDAQVTYSFALVDLPGAKINGLEDGLVVEPHKLGTAEVVVLVPPPAFGLQGRRTVTVRVEGSDGFGHNVSYSLIGPAWLGDPDADRDETEPGEGPEGDD